VIEQARFGGATCRACAGSISRASLRYVELIPTAPRDRYPYRRNEPPKQEHFHLACALQVMPLRLANDLDGFTGTLPNRPMFDRVIALWREAIAEPDDDGPRIVLADLLQSLGDPRGELMSLQLLDRPAERPDGPERVDELVYEHQERWLGRHREVALAAQFRRGLLARLELSDANLPTNELDPALSTVEDLLPGTASAERYRRYVMALRGLRRIEVWDDDTLDAFEQTQAPLVHVACAFPTLGLGEGLAELGARFLRACARHRTLTSLALHATAFEPVAKSPLLGRLTQLTLVGKPRDTLPIWHTLPKTMTVTLGSAARLPTMFEPPPGALVLRHAGPLVTARASGEWMLDGLVAMLPASVGKLELEVATEELAGNIWDQARARALEVAFVQAPVPNGIWRHP
jgi:uncharacterized protein (TIGR02996 family)